MGAAIALIVRRFLVVGEKQHYLYHGLNQRHTA
jgi:hypothetical protein